jgi:hypothetical protein
MKKERKQTPYNIYIYIHIYIYLREGRKEGRAAPGNGPVLPRPKPGKLFMREGGKVVAVRGQKGREIEGEEAKKRNQGEKPRREDKEKRQGEKAGREGKKRRE